ncbi:Oxygen-insensitive NAD(P)H nitroreductase [Granulibacter bethesdensis]|nr:Oxygen-insensitive NAD(P)H nitroreductase [Granulibacter bethesdensis]
MTGQEKGGTLSPDRVIRSYPVASLHAGPELELPKISRIAWLTGRLTARQGHCHIRSSDMSSTMTDTATSSQSDNSTDNPTNAPLHTELPALDERLATSLFRDGRSFDRWKPLPVSDETLRTVYDLARLGPTSGNSCPARFVFIRHPEAKQKLRPALSSGNVEKTMQAPVTVIVAHDPLFYDKLPHLWPYEDARDWFVHNAALAEETAIRNATLQGAYLLLAARAVGLDAGPMSGFDRAKVDSAFLMPQGWRSEFLINLGYGDPEDLPPRAPRLTFEEACEIL